eukprot:tig00021374_g21093.t1
MEAPAPLSMSVRRSVALPRGVQGVLPVGLSNPPSSKARYPPPPFLPPPSLVNPRTAQEDMSLVRALAMADSWNFDAFEFAELTSGRPLYVLGLHVLHSSGCVEALRLDARRADAFLQAVEVAYNAVPYHNATHAADVLQAAHHFARAPLVRCKLSHIDILALLLAAIGHDVGHDGRNNNFEIATGSERAFVYNDRSVMENFHASETFMLLREERLNFAAGLAPEDRRALRRTALAAILATDIASHFEHLGVFKARIQQPGFGASAEDRSLIVGTALKCADLANPARPWPVCQKWAASVMDEFYSQGDAEAGLGLPISPWMDRAAPQMPQCQVGFIEFLVQPLYAAWAACFPPFAPVAEAAAANRRQWKALADASAGAGAGAGSGVGTGTGPNTRRGSTATAAAAGAMIGHQPPSQGSNNSASNSLRRVGGGQPSAPSSMLALMPPSPSSRSGPPPPHARRASGGGVGAASVVHSRSSSIDAGPGPHPQLSTHGRSPSPGPQGLRVPSPGPGTSARYAAAASRRASAAAASAAVIAAAAAHAAVQSARGHRGSKPESEIAAVAAAAAAHAAVSAHASAWDSLSESEFPLSPPARSLRGAGAGGRAAPRLRPASGEEIPKNTPGPAAAPAAGLGAVVPSSRSFSSVRLPALVKDAPDSGAVPPLEARAPLPSIPGSAASGGEGEGAAVAPTLVPSLALPPVPATVVINVDQRFPVPLS